jgi:uncharacterized protein YdhG (YjbR/CyaY superfamily)
MPADLPDQVEDYLARTPEPHRTALKKVRRQIRTAAPNAQEGFGYGLPGFYLNGPLLYYGAAKSHCALYGAIPDGFKRELEGFKTSKGTIKFQPDHMLPSSLVRKLVKARVAENRARAQAKANPKPKPSAKPEKGQSKR